MCTIPIFSLFSCEKSTATCAETPTAVLHKENLKSISVSEKVVSEANQVSFTDAVGYSFKGEAGKTLKYKTDTDVCVWIYTPDNKILKRTAILPQNGNYIIQVAALQGSRSFQIDISYQAKASPSPESSASPISISWKPVCGDPKDSGSQWWAVKGPESALEDVKKKYCGDALIIRGETQVASFTSKTSAQNFANQLSRSSRYSFFVKKSSISQ